MVPRARMTQRWPLRPWRSQRKMYVVIYRGALRRRIRRLVRSRLFNNARTASRNRDLAIRAPQSPAASYSMGGFWPVHGGHNGGLFLASAGSAGDTEASQEMTFTVVFGGCRDKCDAKLAPQLAPNSIKLAGTTGYQQSRAPRKTPTKQDSQGQSGTGRNSQSSFADRCVTTPPRGPTGAHSYTASSEEATEGSSAPFVAPEIALTARFWPRCELRRGSLHVAISCQHPLETGF